MKKLLFLSAMLVIFSTSNAIAQEKMKREKSEEMKAQRKKFFEKELQFSEAESKAFWPIFESHQEEMKQIKDRKNRVKLELMSDAEAEAHLNEHFEREEKILASRKKLVQSLKGKIGVRKIALLPQVERKFKKELLRYYRGKKGGERMGPSGGNRPRGSENRGGGKRRF